MADNAEPQEGKAWPGRWHKKYTPANQGDAWEPCACHWGADHGAD